LLSSTLSTSPPDLPPGASVTAKRRRALATLSWRTVVLLIIGATFWDAASLLIAGNTGYASPSYDLLRQVPGGMRLYGVVLSALVLGTVYAYGRHSKSRRDVLLRIGLACLAAWYTGWLAMILYTWLVQGSIAGLGGISRTVFFSAMCVIASRSAPHATTSPRE
jgi:hypothetical protein